MKLRDTNDFVSDESKYERRGRVSDNCGKCGRSIVDNVGVKIEITSEEEVRLSPGNIKVLDYTFKMCKKCVLRVVGGGGSTFKIKYALEDE